MTWKDAFMDTGREDDTIKADDLLNRHFMWKCPNCGKIHRSLTGSLSSDLVSADPFDNDVECIYCEDCDKFFKLNGSIVTIYDGEWMKGSLFSDGWFLYFKSGGNVWRVD